MEKEFKELKTVSKKIEFLLKSEPELAHNQNKLFMMYYFFEVGKEVINEMNVYEFFILIVDPNNKNVNFETLSRTRRRVISRLKKQGFTFEKPKPEPELVFKIVNK
jgi:hypothetical protein